MFHSNFERKNYKALTFGIVHLANFEISASLELAPPHLTLSKFNKCRERLLDKIR